MLRSSMPAVGVHSSAIACGMILDEGYLLFCVFDSFCKCDFVVCLDVLWLLERRGKEKLSSEREAEHFYFFAYS